MMTSTLRIRNALLCACLLGGCVSNPGLRVEGGAPVIPAIVIQNLSQEWIAVYLVEDTRESLLGRVYPLQNGRFLLGDRVFTSARSPVRLAIVRNGAHSMRPSLEWGTYLSAPIRRGTLAGNTWVFSGDDLWRR